MKRIVTALALAAIPAAAFGQAVSCPDCRHVASYFKGEGGFIGTVADGADEVVFVASCGSVSTTGEARVGGGTAAQLFNHRNGLACDQEGGALEIAGLEDGGWYWITDAANSAVANLVSMDVLDNDATDITSAGEAVEVTMGKGAVYLKETATGRVGILPNILPEPPTPALRKCGYTGAFTAASPGVPLKAECALGDGGTIALATAHNFFTGATTRVLDKGTVMRPTGETATVVVTVDLWGNGSGHFVTTHDAATANGISAGRGQPTLGMSAARAGTRLTGVTYTAKLGSGPTAADLADGVANGGITMDTSTTTNVVTFTVGADADYCSKTNNDPAPVAVTALMATATDADQVTPSIKRNAASGVVGGTSFTVVCGSASSSVNQGRGLAPENPFPAE